MEQMLAPAKTQQFSQGQPISRGTPTNEHCSTLLQRRLRQDGPDGQKMRGGAGCLTALDYLASGLAFGGMICLAGSVCSLSWVVVY